MTAKDAEGTVAIDDVATAPNGDGGIRTLEPRRANAFRVFYTDKKAVKNQDK